MAVEINNFENSFFFFFTFSLLSIERLKGKTCILIFLVILSLEKKWNRTKFLFCIFWFNRIKFKKKRIKEFQNIKNYEYAPPNWSKLLKYPLTLKFEKCPLPLSLRLILNSNSIHAPILNSNSIHAPLFDDIW